MSDRLNNFINNKLSFKKKTNFTLIIGSSPSKGARSPLLWNNAYKSFGQKTRMYPADVSNNNLKKVTILSDIGKNPIKIKIKPFTKEPIIASSLKKLTILLKGDGKPKIFLLL